MWSEKISNMSDVIEQSQYLTVAIATTADRFTNIDIDTLPVDPRWCYAVFCQHLPDSKVEPSVVELARRRSDISLILLPGRGAAASRNAALAYCKTEAVLFTDDDVRLLPQGIAELIAVFLANPAVDLIAGQTLLETGALMKRYPRAPARLNVFNCARIGTVELAVRPARVLSKGVGFDPSFGAGTTNFLGDEYIFVADCLRNRLQGLYRPIPLAVHCGPSSGLDFQGEGAARARARVFQRVFSPALLPLVKLAFIWQHRRRFASPGALWRFARPFLMS